VLDLAVLIPWTILYPLEWEEEKVSSVVVRLVMTMLYRILVMMVTLRYTMSIAHVTSLGTGLDRSTCTRVCWLYSVCF